MTTILDWTKNYRTYTKLDLDSVARNSNGLKAKIFLKLYGIAAKAKLQQTKMIVMCQRFGDLFLLGLIWYYSSNHKTYNIGRLKVYYCCK